MEKNYPIVDSVETLEAAIERVRAAQKKFATYTQEQVDAIFKAAATAANQARIPLAKMAVEETGFGIWQDKVLKNLLGSRITYEYIKDMKTIGVIHEDGAKGIMEVGVPMGVIAALIPSTNPTSTVMYKTLIALKAGNGIVISPHPGAKNCIALARRYALSLLPSAE